jgi:hypothetical protein
MYGLATDMQHLHHCMTRSALPLGDSFSALIWMEYA